MKQQSPEFSKAASSLTLSNIFFTALMYSLKIEADETLPGPAATDGVTLYYNPKTFASMFTAPERVFVLVHEILHVILMHSLRRGIRDPELWNVACDFVVNLLVVEYGFTMPVGEGKGLYDTKYRGMSAEQVYDMLVQESDQKSKDGKGKPEAGDGKGDKGNPLAGDVMDYDPSQNDGKTAAEVEREIGISTSNAIAAAQAAGVLPAGMKRLVGEAQVQHEPWHQHLRRYMTSMHARQYDWARIDARRAVLHGAVSPRMYSEAMGKVVFMVDCSGSITSKQLSAMGAHISDVCRDVNPKEVVVAYFDTEVSFSEEFTGPDYDITLTPHGGGGTDFRTGAAWVEENHSDAMLCAWLTDMYGPFAADSTVETLWVSQTKTVNAPYGTLIEADFNEA